MRLPPNPLNQHPARVDECRVAGVDDRKCVGVKIVAVDRGEIPHFDIEPQCDRVATDDHKRDLRFEVRRRVQEQCVVDHTVLLDIEDRALGLGTE